MRQAAECGAWALALCLGHAVVLGAAQQEVPASVPLRSFTMPKPAGPAPLAPETRRPSPAARSTPASQLTGSIGSGYVQGADGALDLRATGTFAGLHVNLRALATFGPASVLDQRALGITAPDGQWAVDAGDVFSPLTGPGRGARASWSAARGRRPTITLAAPHGRFDNGPTLVTYSDRLVVGRTGLIEGEIASDGSHLLAMRATLGRVSIAAADRRRREPAARDRSVGAGLTTWRRIRLQGSLTRSTRGQESSVWTTAAIRLPLRWLDLTVERAFGVEGTLRTATSSVTASARIGGAQVFHRQQWGSAAQPDILFFRDSRQLQSMAAYRVGARLSIALQLASDWTPAGDTNSWEEVHVGWQTGRHTRVETVVAVPGITSSDRWRLHVTQELPRQFALEFDYGRVAPYRMVSLANDRPRFRATLLYRFRVATPRGRASVRGLVIDHAERPVADVVVRLGPYSAVTDATGRYQFHNVPPGQFDLSVDEQELTANRAWNGAGVHIDTSHPPRQDIVLRVAPLGTITGRIFVDANRDGRCDPGEALAGAVVFLNATNATMTDRDGIYGFYNLPAGPYVVRIEPDSLGPNFRAERVERAVPLVVDRPATGIDFRLEPQSRPIVWSAVP